MLSLAYQAIIGLCRTKVY